MIESAFFGNLQVHRANGHALASVRGIGGKPRPRQVVENRARRHGAAVKTRFYEPRIIELSGRVLGGTVTEALQKLDTVKTALALDSDDDVVFKFRREGWPEDEQVTVRVASDFDAPLAGSSRLIRWEVSLLAGDPRIYAVAQKSASYDPTLAGTGFGLTFPLVFPLTFPGEGFDTHLPVQNQGTFPTPPILTVTGPSTNPVLENDTTGERITTKNLALPTGETLEVDVGARTVTLNGTTERPDLIDPALTQWFDLVPGENLLRLNGTDHLTGQTELAVTFHDARI